MSDLTQNYVEGEIVGLSPWETFEVVCPGVSPLFPVEEFYSPPLDLFSAEFDTGLDDALAFIAFLQAQYDAMAMPIPSYKEKYVVNPETGNYRIIR